jgi:hypothetical protein
MTELTATNFPLILRAIEQRDLPPGVRIDDDGLRWDGNVNWAPCLNNLNGLINDLPRYVQKSFAERKYYNVGSYKAKNSLERMRIERKLPPRYNSNGDFIFAMLYLGYEMKPLVINHAAHCIVEPASETGKLVKEIKPLNPNATFNASIRNLKYVTCVCGNEYVALSKTAHYAGKVHKAIMRERNRLSKDIV